MSTTRDATTERAEAMDKLRRWFPPGSTVHCVLRHVSRSGMRRNISLVLIDHDGPTEVSGFVARVLNMRRAADGGLVTSGCGMDMGFHLVYNLSRVLYADGFECCGEGQRCPSNDHSNGDRNYSPDHVHSDPGYALRSRWI